MPLYLSEVHINQTKGYRFGDSGIYEAYTADRGRLFRSLSQEYGRCTGKIYLDKEDGRTIAVGWVFEKRMRYEDSSEFYIREVWVTLYERPDTIVHHYKDLGGK